MEELEHLLSSLQHGLQEREVGFSFSPTFEIFSLIPATGIFLPSSAIEIFLPRSAIQIFSLSLANEIFSLSLSLKSLIGFNFRMSFNGAHGLRRWFLRIKMYHGWLRVFWVFLGGGKDPLNYTFRDFLENAHCVCSNGQKTLSSGQNWFLRWVISDFGGYFVLKTCLCFSFPGSEVPFPGYCYSRIFRKKK